MANNDKAPLMQAPEQPPAYAYPTTASAAPAGYPSQPPPNAYQGGYVDPYGGNYGSTVAVTHTTYNTNQGMYATWSRPFDHWTAQKKLAVIVTFLVVFTFFGFGINMFMRNWMFCDLNGEVGCTDSAMCVWNNVTETCQSR
jgi:hypothetical protein